MRKKRILTVVLAGFISWVGWSAGFGLYEPTTKAHALGGALLGRAVDASANFINPATLTDLTNITVSVGFVTEHPRAQMKVDGHHATSMDPGAFMLPHLQAAVPLPWDFTFGLGLMPEYGLGSEYTRDWALVANSHDTTVISFTLNPNLAWRVTPDWSVAAGFRVLFFDFEQHSYPMPRVKQRLKGDNGFADWGWQIGTKYDLLENLALGVVYKSHTDVRVKGTSRMTVPYATNGDAATVLDLPQSVTAGLNWDVTSAWHLGFAAAWTQWSSVDTLDFNLNGIHKPIGLRWRDTWRVGVAPSWDFARDWTAMCSYAFETDCSGHQDSTMLPASDRHMLAAGLAWRITPCLELAASYGVILMHGRESDCTVNGVAHRYTPHRGICHSAGLTLTYSF